MCLVTLLHQTFSTLVHFLGVICFDKVFFGQDRAIRGQWNNFSMACTTQQSTFSVSITYLFQTWLLVQSCWKHQQLFHSCAFWSCAFELSSIGCGVTVQSQTITPEDNVRGFLIRKGAGGFRDVGNNVNTHTHIYVRMYVSMHSWMMSKWQGQGWPVRRWW